MPITSHFSWKSGKILPRIIFIYKWWCRLSPLCNTFIINSNKTLWFYISITLDICTLLESVNKRVIKKPRKSYNLQLYLLLLTCYCNIWAVYVLSITFDLEHFIPCIAYILVNGKLKILSIHIHPTIWMQL